MDKKDMSKIVNEMFEHDLTPKAIEDYLFLKKQMKLRFKTRRHTFTELDMVLLNLMFAIKWVQEFDPIVDLDLVNLNG
jgi:hypothetical protein